MAQKNKTYEEELLEQTEQQSAPVASRQEAENALSGLNYQKSDSVLAAEKALADYTAQKPGAYQSSYQQKLDELLTQIETRGPLEYSFDADPLYQQYKDQYTRSARLAMQDTVADLTAATGGYGSSYAASAGSQAYQQQIAGLDDALPALYGLALERWNAENEALHIRLNELAGLEQDAQNAYQDTLDSYYTELEWLTNAAGDAYDKDYKAFVARRDALTDLRDYYAAQEQQAVKNAESQAEYELAVKKYEESVRQWEAEQAAAREKWQAQLAWEQEQFAQELALQKAKAAASAAASASSGKSGSGSSGKSSSASGSSTTTLSAAARQVQQAMTQRANALTSRVGTGGVDAGRRNKLLREMLRGYCSDGTITKAEANLIGKKWGITV